MGRSRSVRRFPTVAASTTLTPAERSMRASIAALTRWSKEDPTENALRGQAGLRNKFLRQVDQETPGLPEPERHRRAEAAYRAHMKRLRFKRSRRDEAAIA